MYFEDDFKKDIFLTTPILICMYRPESYYKALIYASTFSIPSEPLLMGLHTKLMRFAERGSL